MKKKNSAGGQDKATREPPVWPKDLARLMVDSILAAARRKERGHADTADAASDPVNGPESAPIKPDQTESNQIKPDQTNAS